MAAKADHEKIVKTYFSYIKDLRAGKDGAVDRLVSLWHEDGVFEFAGAPPVTGTFRGRNAIHVLYQNRLHANGMKLGSRLKGKKGEASMQAALGVVDTEVNRVRAMDDKLVAGWTTTIGTDRKQGFEVSGAHTFTFLDGKISSLKVVVSPRAETAERVGLSMEELAVDDIGQLSLAAWAVV